MGPPYGPDGTPKGPQWTHKALMVPLNVHDRPLKGPNVAPTGLHRGLFVGYLGVEGGPLVFLYSFLSLVHQLDLVLSFWPPWAPMGLNRAHLWAPSGPWGP
jgi:hypothetical protein